VTRRGGEELGSDEKQGQWEIDAMQSDETIECPEARRGADSLLRKDG